MTTNFPTSLDSYDEEVDNVDYVCASHINDLQDAVNALEIKVGADSSATDITLDYKVNNFFVEDTRKIYIYENNAPVGWSIEGVSDAVVAIKGGSQDYGVSGGNVAGLWLMATHCLTEGETPAHTHSHIVGGTFDGTGVLHNVTKSTGAGSNTGYTGSGTGHSPGNTYRPYAAVGIIIKFSGS